MLVSLDSSNAKTIQTHNAVSVAANNGTSASAWIDCAGYTDISATFRNDAATNSNLVLNWNNDNTSSAQGQETLIASSTQTVKAGSTKVKARYVQVLLMNGDAAVAHTMSGWIYLLTL